MLSTLVLEYTSVQFRDLHALRHRASADILRQFSVVVVVVVVGVVVVVVAVVAVAVVVVRRGPVPQSV